MLPSLSRRRLLAALSLLVVTSAPVRAQTTVDSFNPGSSDDVRAIAVQPDGKVLVGGSFTKIGGGDFGSTTRNHIARLNADGTVDASFNPGANDDVLVFALQSDGKILVGGLFTAMGGSGSGTTTRNRIARLNADGTLDTAFNPGANAVVLDLAVQSDGKIIVAGSFTTFGGGGTGTTARKHIARLNADGSIETAFDPGPDGEVQHVVVQADGGILIAGDFTKLGSNGTSARFGFARLNPDGSLDTSFDPQPNSVVYGIVQQPDGRIVIAGGFTRLGNLVTGFARAGVARISAAGVVDAQFDPGSNGYVHAIALQPDGKMVIGGSFSKVGGGGSGTARQTLARINPDGTVDVGFDPGANGIGIDRLALQSDGKILVTGDFTQIGGGGTGTTLRNGIARINSGVAPAGPAPTITSVSPSGGWGGGQTAITITGSGFQGGALVTVGGMSATSIVVASATTITATTPPHAGGAVNVVVTNPDLQSATKSGAYTYASTTDVDSFDPVQDQLGAAVNAIVVQADGRLVIGGFFNTLGSGTSAVFRYQIGRVNSDGSPDTGFVGGADGLVTALALQADGRIVVGGYFAKLGGGSGVAPSAVTPRSRIGRLNADGSLDTAFNPGADGAVTALAVQADGRIIVGGNFTTLAGASRNRIGRLNADGSIDAGFNPGASDLVKSIVVQPDGKILVASPYPFGAPSEGLRRLNVDGSVDATFNPPPGGTGPVALLSDGKIIVGGIFTNSDGTTLREGAARLNADGSLDPSFNTGGTDDYFGAILPRPDGRVVVGGLFHRIGAATVGAPNEDTRRSNIALLKADGSVDTSVDVGTNGEVRVLAAQADGKVLAGGTFTKMGGGGTGVTLRNAIARFNLPSAPPAITSIAPASGPIAGGTAITIAGSGFQTGATVSIGGVAATSVAVPSSTTISAVTPAHAAGVTDVVVTNPDLQSATKTTAFTYTAPASCTYTLSPTAASFGTAGGTGSVTVTPSASSCTWTAVSNVSFITVTAGASGTGNGTVGYSVGSATAARTGTLTIAGQTVTVGQGALPQMALDKTSLTFGATIARFFPAFWTTTRPQQVRLTQSGPGTVTWTATSSQPYLTVSPAQGTGSATLTIALVSTTNYFADTPQITLSFSGAANAPGPIEVVVNTKFLSAAAAPGGAFDTPADGATGVTGSIAVSGWAIDDLEVSRIRIYRDPVGAEGTAQIYLGDGVFVDGARPDVQALNPTAPLNSRAGWGYLLLTNFLPNLGNGTFKLYAYADDIDGHTTLLGSKTITCSNAMASTPFGAIDTPAQGEVITTPSYVNFGWALSPGARKAAPPDGGQVQVVVDGALVGQPSGWTSRQDLTALFPAAGFSGISKALGVATLDTSVLSNGTHTISWLVTDNQGGASGIGSRYFTVSNGSGLTLADLGGPAFDGAQAREGLRSERVAQGFSPASGITGRRGFDLTAPYRTYDADADGRITIQSEELDRIELELEGVEGGRRVEGALRVGDRFAPLPIGSRIDPVTGTFTWNPGVGFVGVYDLVLDGRDVRVVLNPKGSGRVGAQTVIDVADGARVAGWAADLDSPYGTGVSAVHVWAYPTSGNSPVFLGAANYGGARPDVGAVHGDRFTNSGYGLAIDGLAPGEYDVAIFALRTATGRWAPASVVRVRVQ